MTETPQQVRPYTQPATHLARLVPACSERITSGATAMATDQLRGAPSGSSAGRSPLQLLVLMLVAGLKARAFALPASVSRSSRVCAAAKASLAPRRTCSATMATAAVAVGQEAAVKQVR